MIIRVHVSAVNKVIFRMYPYHDGTLYYTANKKALFQIPFLSLTYHWSKTQRNLKLKIFQGHAYFHKSAEN